MDHVEPEELDVYRPQDNGFISNAFGAEVNFGLFSVKNDKANPLLLNDHGNDADDDISNIDMLRDWTRRNRAHAMSEFGVTKWEPDLTF